VATFSNLYSSRLTQELGTDDASRLFTTARRKNAINTGLLTFTDLTECLRAQDAVTSSHGVREYNLLSTSILAGGDAYLRLSKRGPEYHFTSSAGVVTYVAGKDFPRREIAWLNDNEPGWRGSTGGTPSAYYERFDNGRRFFGVNTPPQIVSSAGESALFLIPYVMQPPILTSDTDVPFTIAARVRTDLVPFHQAAVHFAASDLEKLRVNTEAVAGQWAMAMGYVERFLRTFGPRGPRVIRTARNYFSEIRARRGEVEEGLPIR